MDSAPKFDGVAPSIAQEQWGGLYPCRFTPSAETKREHALQARGHFCLIPRFGYLYLSVVEVLGHFFERVEQVAQHRILFEVVTERQRVAVPEYYPLGVILDLVHAAHGSPVGYIRDGYVRIEFSLLLAPLQQPNLCQFSVSGARRFGQLLLQQQQKAACSAMFGTTAPITKTHRHILQGLQDSIAQNNVHQFFLARNDIWERGTHEVERFPTKCSVGPWGVFVLHMDGAHAKRSVPLKQCPTLGALLRAFVPGFHEADGDYEAGEQLPETPKVLLCGISPLLTTPTAFLVSHLSAADFCVHLTILRGVG